MTDLFSKPLETIDRTDLDWLLEHGPPEGPTVEYKGGLSETGDDPDPWNADQKPGRSISRRAKERIVKEVIAFANSGGGTLLLGILETDEDPPRPAGINPIARCGDLAAHLTDVLRDAVDPQLPALHLHPIAVQGDAGVVLVRVPPSRRAPHRCDLTKRVFKRLHDQSVPINMREIHDLVLQVRSGNERIEQTFTERRQRFEAEWGTRFPHSDQPAYAMSVTITPVADLPLGRLNESIPVASQPSQFSATLVGEPDREVMLRVGVAYGQRRPIVRGQRYSGQDGDCWYQLDALQNGTVEFRYREDAGPLTYQYEEPDKALVLRPGWVFGHFTKAILAAHWLRCLAGTPEAELVIDLHMMPGQPNIPIKKVVAAWDRFTFDGYSKWAFFDEFPVFPRYSLGRVDELPDLLSLAHQDFWDGVNRSFDWTLRVDVPQILKAAGFTVTKLS